MYLINNTDLATLILFYSAEMSKEMMSIFGFSNPEEKYNFPHTKSLPMGILRNKVIHVKESKSEP